MADFGWSYPAGCSGTPDDEEWPCEVCEVDAAECDCPECPECGQQGEPDCYRHHGLPYRKDSIHAFLQHIGIEPLSDALHAIERHNLEHAWVVLPYGERVYYHDHKRLAELDGMEHVRLHGVGVGAIRWDGTDAEFGREIPAGDWAALDDLREEANEWANEDEEDF